MRFLFVLLVPVLILLVFLSKSKKTVRESQRLVVFRLGKLFDVREPGLHLLVPFVDEGKLVELQTVVPEWRSLSKAQVEDRVVMHTAGQAALNEWIANDRKRVVLQKG